MEDDAIKKEDDTIKKEDDIIKDSQNKKKKFRIYIKKIKFEEILS